MAKLQLPAWLPRVWTVLMVLLVFTGFGQMPLYKRYFISDIPGMAWSADFYFMNSFHYVLAALFLALVGYVVGAYWTARSQFRLTAIGKARIGVYGLIVFTGLLRVLKNQPDIAFDPIFTMFFDIGHIMAVMMLGMVALASLFGGKRAYIR